MTRKQKWIAGSATILILLYIAGGKEQQNASIQAQPELPPIITPGFEAFDVRVWSDPRARYKIWDVQNRGGGLVVFISSQSNSMGTSYAQRETNCVDGRFRYTAEADDLEGLRKPSAPMAMGQLFAGSISTILSEAACERVGLRLRGVRDL